MSKAVVYANCGTFKEMREKHFFADYLACLIFGSTIVPLYYFWKNYPIFSVKNILFSTVIFACVHIFCFLGLKWFFREKEVSIFCLYGFWSIFWFAYPITRKLFFLSDPSIGCRLFFSLACGVSALLMLLFLIRKAKSDFKINGIIGKFVYSLFILLLLSSVGKIFFYHRNRPVAVTHVPAESTYPNIYHILLDAHPSLKGFEQIGGDLSPFYRELERLGFLTYPKSKSVYSWTYVSVPSMWHMDARLHYSIDGSIVLETLLQNYNVKLYASDGLVQKLYPKNFVTLSVGFPFVKWFYFLLQQTVWRVAFKGMFLETQVKESYKEAHYAVFCNLMDGKRHYGSRGNFFYGHILSPHAPLVYSDGSNSTIASGFQMGDGDWFFEPGMLSLLRNEVYSIDNLALRTIKDILKQYRNEPVKPIIILHSDHGPMRGTEHIGRRSLATIDTCFGNLFAVYMPQEWKKDAKGLKFINLYRFIFNHLFGAHYEYLLDVQKTDDKQEQIIFAEGALSYAK